MSIRKPFQIYNNISKWKIKGWNKMYNENISQRQARMATLIWDKVDIRTKKMAKDREEYYINNKWSNPS